MAVPRRVDPVEIVARVGSVFPGFGGSERAYQVWVNMVQRAGWVVVEEPGYRQIVDGTQCGVVLIEGLSYRVHYGLRVRTDLADDSSGHLSWKPVLAYAAWAEPDLATYSLD